MNLRLGDLLATYTPEKRRAEKLELWTYLVVRPLSWVPALLFLKAGISANTVTWLSILAAIAGSALVAFGSAAAALAGTAFLLLWAVLDCADGTVARFSKTSGNRGEFLDALGGYAMNALVFPAAGVFGWRGAAGLLAAGGNGAAGQAAAAGLDPVWAGGVWALVAGFLAAESGLAARLLYQKYRNLAGEGARELKPKGGGSLLVAAAQNLVSVTGLLVPLLVLALLFGATGLFVTLYAAVNIVMLLFSLFKILKDI